MRYLYGDSHPFPFEYNALSLLEVFLQSATRAAELVGEVRGLETTYMASSATRSKSIEGLEVFHATLMGAVSDAASQSTEVLVPSYVERLSRYAADAVAEERRAAEGADERERSMMRAEVERRRREVRTVIEGFLLSEHLPAPVSSATVTWHESRHVVTAVLTNADGTAVEIELDAHALPVWQAPRRVGEFIAKLSLPVGVRKAWLSRATTPEVIQLTDHYLGGFTLTERTADIRLRRKPELRDNLVIHLRYEESKRLTAEVERVGEDEGLEAPAVELETDDLMQLGELWKQLRAAMRETLRHKDRLLSARYNNQDVLHDDELLAFVTRMINLLGPVVTEIARRSPNPRELSLKREHDDGRREEVYLRKTELLQRLRALPADQRDRFAPLGLLAEDGVPTGA
jgi:hypothetical protein